MTSTTPALPRTAAQRLRFALTDSWTITRRSLAHWVRRPAPVVVGLLFPVLVVVMFGYLLGGQMQVPPGTDYFDFLIPGTFVLTMVFGIEATMIAVHSDAAKGVTNRFRSMPIAGSAVVAGRSIADMLNSLLGLAVLVACGLVVGWRWDDGLGPALGALGLLLLLRFALVWVGIYLSLAVKSAEAVGAVQILVWPLGFLSSAFVSPESMPGWVGTIAEWNPISSTATAIRELFGNPGWESSSWIAEHAELMAIVWPLAILAVFVPLSARRYRGLGG